MVKHILFLLSILFPVFGFSQDTRLFQNDWQLTRLTIDNNNYYNPKTTDGTPVMLWFYEDNHGDMFLTWVCDSKQGEINFDITNPEFTILNTGTTLGGCGVFYDPNKIEMIYFNFYSEESVLSYFIENTSDGLILTITNSNGDEAIYSEPKPMERIGSGSWQLTDLWVNSEQVTNLVDNNDNPINTVFNIDASQQIDFFSFSVCENIEGQINYLSDMGTSFSVTNTTTTSGGCVIDPPLNPDDIYDIDGKLFDFYNQNGTYFYVIVEEGLHTPKKLTIAAPNFDYAIYEKLPVIEKIDLGDWYLSNLIIDSEDNLNPTDARGFNVITNFGSSEGAYYWGSWICDSMGGSIFYDSNSKKFTLSAITTTFGGCDEFFDVDENPTEFYDFNSNFYDFYSMSGDYEYNIISLTESDSRELTITAPNGDKAIYSNKRYEFDKIDLGDWYLTNLIIDSEENLNPIDFEGKNIVTNLKTSQGKYTFSNWVCDSCEGQFNYVPESNSFTISNMGCTLGGCETYIPDGIDPFEVQENDIKLSNFFSTEGLFSYEITEASSNNPQSLIITASNGDKAIYNRVLLSTKSFTKLSFSIYPNPVAKELFVSFPNSKLKNYSVEVFDLLGRIRLSKMLSNSKKPINIESLAKGLYLLKIKDDFGNTSTKKFIKI